jgi:hypothetical protein
MFNVYHKIGKKKLRETLIIQSSQSENTVLLSYFVNRNATQIFWFGSPKFAVKEMLKRIPKMIGIPLEKIRIISFSRKNCPKIRIRRIRLHDSSLPFQSPTRPQDSWQEHRVHLEFTRSCPIYCWRQQLCMYGISFLWGLADVHAR